MGIVVICLTATNYNTATFAKIIYSIKKNNDIKTLRNLFSRINAVLEKYMAASNIGQIPIQNMEFLPNVLLILNSDHSYRFNLSVSEPNIAGYKIVYEYR